MAMTCMQSYAAAGDPYLFSLGMGELAKAVGADYADHYREKERRALQKAQLSSLVDACERNREENERIRSANRAELCARDRADRVPRQGRDL